MNWSERDYCTDSDSDATLPIEGLPIEGFKYAVSRAQESRVPWESGLEPWNIAACKRKGCHQVVLKVVILYHSGLGLDTSGCVALQMVQSSVGLAGR